MIPCLVCFTSAIAAASSAPEMQPGAVKNFPECIVKDVALRSGKPVFTDVRPFLRQTDAHRYRSVIYSSAGQIGMVLHDDPHNLGELVKDVVPGSQAADAEVQRGWIITEIDGRKFSRVERLKDVAEDFAKAKNQGETLTVKYDIRAFLDCAAGDCTSSDRFPADDAETCADACAQTDACEWWSFGALDGDNMCKLQSQSGSSMRKWPGMQTGPSLCAPKPSSRFPHFLASYWPMCQVRDAQIPAAVRGGEPVFADVTGFIERGDDMRHRTITFVSEPHVGMVLRDLPHADGEVVDEVQRGSPAWTAGVRRGWIIKELDGEPFRKNETLPGIGTLFQHAKDEAPSIVVKFDILSYVDCTDGDCYHSDKFPVTSPAKCASACHEIEACRWWSYGLEFGDPMCWLRASDRGLKPQKGSISGQQVCSPPSWDVLCKLFFFLATVGALLYRHEILTMFYSRQQLVDRLKHGACGRLQGGNGPQTKSMAASLVGKVSRLSVHLKRDDGESYDLDLDGADEERAGLLVKAEDFDFEL